MTMPHLMNCSHSGDGWCLVCIKELYEDRERLLRGDFTEEEFQNLCHNFSEDDADRFRKGCVEYQNKLFGAISCAATETWQYPSFDAWYNEIEEFSLRGEYLSAPVKELKAAFEAGRLVKLVQ